MTGTPADTALRSNASMRSCDMGCVRRASRLLHKASRSLSRFQWVGRSRAGSTLLSCTTDKLLAITCMHARTNRSMIVIIVIIVVMTRIMDIKTLASS